MAAKRDGILCGCECDQPKCFDNHICPPKVCEATHMKIHPDQMSSCNDIENAFVSPNMIMFDEDCTRCDLEPSPYSRCQLKKLDSKMEMEMEGGVMDLKNNGRPNWIRYPDCEGKEMVHPTRRKGMRQNQETKKWHYVLHK